ncbi:aspartic proteinase 36-like [Cicer arietinum]|uniref:aspartic proteinase 36-like n=1 Tax=Cicer arietinum TaxID=3827 RepID=UPI003CC58B44
MQFYISTLLLLACYMANVIVPTVCTHYLPLKRIFPLNPRVDMDTLRARDKARYSRMLHGSVDVINFTLQGDPNSIGFYTTTVKLGSPPKELTVVVDTGSSAMWVNCKTCSNCHSNALGFKLNFFDTTASSTAVLVQCSDIRCPLRFPGAEAHCSTNQCSYSYGYQDGSKTSGVYVSDEMYFDTILKQSSPVTVNSSETIVFGCSTKQSGAVTETGVTLDGVIGFGPGVISVFSQLSSKRITPKVFSHCLKGDSNGGGILVFGAILESNIVYSPMVPSQIHYSLNLHSIYVNGKQLQINPNVFATSNEQGTIVDSGTTLAYIVQEAYNPLVHAITTAVSRFATPFISQKETRAIQSQPALIIFLQLV